MGKDIFPLKNIISYCEDIDDADGGMDKL